MSSSPPSLRALDEPKLRAMIELMFLAASADGEFSAEERQHFMNSVQSLTDRQVSADTLHNLIDTIETTLKQSSREDRLAVVKDSLATAALRKVAFSLAVQVTAADGIIRTTERELLLEVAEALDINRDEAADVVKELAP